MESSSTELSRSTLLYILAVWLIATAIAGAVCFVHLDEQQHTIIEKLEEGEGGE